MYNSKTGALALTVGFFNRMTIIILSIEIGERNRYVTQKTSINRKA